MTSTLVATESRSGTLGGERKGWIEQVALAAFIAVPFVAILLAVPVARGGGLGWSDVLLSFVLYALTGHGITVGFHRYLTHGSFKARRPLRVGLAVLKGQVDSGARVIQLFEACGWAYAVRWPRQERLDARRVA